MASAEYELDGYQTRPGHVTGSGEIRATPQILKSVFGNRGLALRTDDGRVLSIRFSEKRLGPQDAIAAVEFVGDLPSAPHWGR